MSEQTDRIEIMDSVNDFKEAMMTRMLAKYDSGLRGWDDPKRIAEFEGRLMRATLAGEYVNVANLAMMLNRLKNRERNPNAQENPDNK